MTQNDTMRRAALGCVLGAAAGQHAPAWLLDLLGEGLAGVSLFATNVIHDNGTQPPPFTDQVRNANADAVIAIDEEGGDVTRLGARDGAVLPSHAVLGHLDQLDLTEQTAYRIGRNLSSRHINLNYAPCADVNSVDMNPVIGTRSFGQDPARIGDHVRAYIGGLHHAGVAACAKHFPGHGSTSLDSHVSLPRIDDPFEVVTQRDLPPFLAAIDAGTDAIMLGHLQLPQFGDLPASQNPLLISWLRDELGFDGIIVTDALDMEAVSDGVNLGPASVASLAAGNDLLCLGSNLGHHQVSAVLDAIVEAIDDGTLSLDQLEASAERNQVSARATTQPGDHTTSLRTMESDRDFGFAVAARAVEVSGTLAGVVHPVIIECRADSSNASTDTMWGVAHLVEDAPWPRAVLTVDEHADHLAIAEVVRDRPAVVVVRGLTARPWQRSVLAQAAPASRLVVVELGWPSRPVEPHQTYVTTRSASLASCKAVADLLERTHYDQTLPKN